jgi:hypothetical protein
MSRQRSFPFFRLALLFLLICINAVLLMGLRPHKAHAGAGGIEGGNCGDIFPSSGATTDPTLECFGNCATASPEVMGSPNSFVSAPASMSTPRAFFASTALQVDGNPTVPMDTDVNAGTYPFVPISIVSQSCGPALNVFRFGLITGGIIDSQGDVTDSAEILGPVINCCGDSPPAACGTSVECEGGLALPPTPQYLTGFVPTANMGSKRVLHQATLFSFTFTVPSAQATNAALTATAKVLITGGSSDLSSGLHSTSALSSAEIFTFNATSPGGISAENSFVPTGSMNVKRTLHQATLLESGKVLITGGLNEKREALNTAEIFNPAGNTGQGSFTFTTGKMRHARFGHTATLLDDGTGDVLITGGYSSGEGYLNLAGSSNTNLRAAVTATAEIYDPATDTFSDAGRMQVARAGHTASRISLSSPQLAGAVLIAGGINNQGVTNTAELYNSGKFTSVPNMGSPRFLHAAASIMTGDILIAGGTSGMPNLQTSLDTAELFDPSSSKFVPITSMLSTPRRGFSAGSDIPIELSDMVILLGGLDSSGPSFSADIFIPSSTP